MGRMMRMLRLLLADRMKRREDRLPPPLSPALGQQYEAHFISVGSGKDLAAVIARADVVLLE
jgi:hypothetical protein